MKEWMNDLSKGSQYLEQEITTKKGSDVTRCDRSSSLTGCADLTASYCKTDYSIGLFNKVGSDQPPQPCLTSGPHSDEGTHSYSASCHHNS